MSDILINLYDSRSLTEAINLIKPPEPFLLNRIFKRKEQHASDTVDVEIMPGSAKIAQFSHQDDNEPRPISKLTKSVQTITIPRTFESKNFTAKELNDINAIGNIYSDPASKMRAQNEKITEELEDLKNRVFRLREKLCAEALVAGTISVDQDNIAFGLDFGFISNTHTFTHTGTDLWTNADSDPLVKLRSYQRKIMKGAGLNADICLLGESAAEAFQANENIRKKLDANNFRVGALDMTGIESNAVMYIGRLLGMDFYEYNQQYVNSSGTATNMFSSDRCVLVASGGPFRLHLGAAYRIREQTAIAIMGEFLLEIDSRSDETKLQWNCEQKSIPTIHDPYCVISAKVV